MKELKKYLIDGEEVTKEEFEERLEEELEEYVRDNYDDLLNDCYEEVEVGYCTFTVSEILKKCDPVAYNCGMNDEIDNRISDASWELERYGTYEVNGYEFEIEEVEEEEEEEEKK